MSVTRRNTGKRSQRSSNWMSALMLECIALLAFVGAAQPLWFQNTLQRFNPSTTPARETVDARSSKLNHPMDAFQQPMLAPIEYQQYRPYYQSEFRMPATQFGT